MEKKFGSHWHQQLLTDNADLSLSLLSPNIVSYYYCNILFCIANNPD